MKLAVLAGNRFSPWHFNVFRHTPGLQATGFRADSEIQRRFDERGADILPLPFEPVYFDTQRGPLPLRVANLLAERYRNRAPRLCPFHDRLRGFDALLSWELFTEWTHEALEAKAQNGVPVNVMVWDNILFNNEDTEAKRATKARAFREADRFLVHTERSRQMLLLEGADPERIQLIPPGVDLHAFAPGQAQRGGEDTLTILFVGWLLPRKGIDFLLQALRLLKERPGPRLRLLIAGSGPGEPRVRALVDRLGLSDDCTFLPPCPYADMPALYHQADLFALPSIATDTWQEQFGMALIEAMACGVPVVSTLSGAIPEVVGDAGLLCQPNDFLSLAESIARLRADPALRQSLAAAGRRHAETHFCITAQARHLQSALVSRS
ncbi:MAG: hypothetical protein RLZZ303_1157 [Candidatus Hydrogenedentota bacterium]|jgi:glycosyltransferase involved in cell wall biosynthesis